MYTRNEVARMQPDELIAALDDAEECLLEVEKAEQHRNEFISKKNELLSTRDDLEQNGTKLPLPIKESLI
ncbi:MAG: hypothetical protein LUD84_09955 [Clostridiales bacterium]|nr:hypothetical protein [Clostridiales bacterium]